MECRCTDVHAARLKRGTRSAMSRSASAAMPTSAPRPSSRRADIHLERHAELRSCRSSASRTWPVSSVDEVAAHFEHELVVHLHDELRVDAASRASQRSTSIMARLMMSAAVPCIGALIAARSAPWRSAALRRADVVQIEAPAEHRFDVAALTRLLARLVHVAAHAGIALEIQLDVLRRLRALDAEPASRGRTPTCRRSGRS